MPAGASVALRTAGVAGSGATGFMDPIFGWIASYGYVALAVLLMLGIVGLPIPDETLLMFTGYLVFRGQLAFVPAVITAVSGSLCGISVSYALGRSLGPYLVERFGPYVHLDVDKLAQVRAWYDRWGKYALLFGYFVPGVRHLAAYAAGSARVPLLVFAAFAYTGGVLWATSFIVLGYVVGEEWARLSGTVHRYLLIAAGAALVGVGIALAMARQRRRSGPRQR
jgi:membrane protein DedA with SNARE-associated domain